MPKCSVLGCKNDAKRTKNSGIHYFRFPRDEAMRNIWVQKCQIKVNLTTATACSVHFTSSDYFKSLQHQLLQHWPQRCRTLKIDAVPSLNLPDLSAGSEEVIPKLEIYEESFMDDGVDEKMFVGSNVDNIVFEKGTQTPYSSSGDASTQTFPSFSKDTSSSPQHEIAILRNALEMSSRQNIALENEIFLLHKQMQDMK